jgi:flagellar hook-associated protein 1 FlgK
MSLVGALNIGKSALAVHQAAIQTTGNNISNAGNADYTRQRVELAAVKDRMIQTGIFAGQGVQLTGIRRQIDEALESRLRSALSDSEQSQVSQQWLGQVESVFNELSDSDLSSRLSAFFASWSNLANKPQDVGLRQVVIQNGQAVAGWMRDVRGQLTTLQETLDERLPDAVAEADRLAQRIAELNGQIVTTEGGQGLANGLRDQRDAALKELSTLVDVKTIEQPNGTLNVYIGSEPLVQGSDNRGLTIVTTGGPDQPNPEVRFKANLGSVSLKSGQIAGLISSRQTITQSVREIDDMAGALVFDLNKIHAAGQGLEGFASVSATNVVEDATVALNDEATGLKHLAANGSFVVHVKDKATGLVTSSLIQIDLDGLNGNDTTLNDLTAQLSGVAGVNASVNAGQLNVAADSAAVEISFSQDSSGVLASLGINTFFRGTDASNIAVNDTVVSNPGLLAAARNGQKGDNQTARLIAGLENQPVAAFSGQSLKQKYEGMITQLATQASNAKSDAEATQGILETLNTQRQSLSGVSLDEEAVNLMQQQRAFQGAARLVTTINDLMDVVLNMVR